MKPLTTADIALVLFERSTDLTLYSADDFLATKDNEPVKSR